MSGVYYNGVYTEPKGGARDGYETRPGNTRTGIIRATERIQRELEIERLRATIDRCDGVVLVCRECRQHYAACDCPRSVQIKTPLVPLPNGAS